MKMQTERVTILLFGLILSISQLVLGQTTGINIISYHIEAIIRPHGDVVEVTTTCDIQKTDTTLQTQLLFSSSAKLQAVQSSANGGWSEIPFHFVGKDTLQLSFPTAMRQAGPFTIEFRYTFPIGPLGDSLLLLDRGSRWYPLISDQIAKLSLRCEVPSGYTVLSAGDLLETKASEVSSQFVWETKLPIFKLPLVVFKSSTLKKDSSRVLNKKIVLYSSTADTLSTASILAEASNVFMFFTDVIGECPYEHLTLVEVPYFEGVDISSGLLMVGSSSLKGMGRGYFDALHLTVAEQWIGAGVFAKFRQPGFWFLTISLPHYLRLMYVRYSKGEEAFDEALHEPLKQYEKFSGKENDVPIIDVDFPNSKEKGVVLYGKGPLVISKLHRQLGDDQWKALLRDLYREFLGKILTYDEFLSYISKHDKGGSSLTLLNRLMTQKGIPED
jgi:hypothetical protein